MSVINTPRTGRDKRGRFLLGKSGNLAGRPPEPESLTAWLRKVGAEEVPVETPQGVKSMTRLEAIARRAYELADAGSVRALALLLERLDGKPAQGVDVNLRGEPATAENILACALRLAAQDEQEPRPPYNPDDAEVRIPVS